MSQAYAAFRKTLEKAGWDDVGRGCWARPEPVADDSGEGWGVKHLDPDTASIVARWVDEKTHRNGYQRMLSECEELSRACRAALGSSAQLELFEKGVSR